MGRSLPLCVQREWYSLRDIQEVFRISREVIATMLRDAESRGMSIKVLVLDFRNHPLLVRQRPFIRVERLSLTRYLAAYCGGAEPEATNSTWMEWLSPRDIEKIYGFSQESMKRILKDAEWQGMPIKVMYLPFANGSRTVRRPHRYQVERLSLNAYLNSHLAKL